MNITLKKKKTKICNLITRANKGVFNVNINKRYIYHSLFGKYKKNICKSFQWIKLLAQLILY